MTISPLDRPNRSIPSRVFGSITPGGVRQSVFTLISTAMGGGLLCLPFVMRECGWLLGSLLLCTSALIGYFSMTMLIHSAHKVRKYSYSSLLAHCLGSWTGPLLDMIIVMYGVGALVAYLIFLGDFIPPIAKFIVHTDCSRSLAILLSAFSVSPMVFPAKLSALKYASPISTICLIFTASVTLIEARAMHRSASDGEFRAVIWSPNILRSFVITLFAYVCHLNVVPVAGEMVEQTSARTQKIVGRVNSILLAFYAIIGVCGYYSFGGFVSQNFVADYPPDSLLVLLCRCMLTLSLLICLPINATPVAHAFIHFLHVSGIVNHRNTGIQSPLLPEASEEEPYKNLRISIAIGSLFVAALIAIEVPGAANVLGVLGGSFGTILMIICPLVIYNNVFRDQITTATRIVMFFLILAAFISFIAVGVMLGSII